MLPLETLMSVIHKHSYLFAKPVLGMKGCDGVIFFAILSLLRNTSQNVLKIEPDYSGKMA